jgi:hypothetical protein
MTPKEQAIELIDNFLINGFHHQTSVIGAIITAHEIKEKLIIYCSKEDLEIIETNWNNVILELKKYENLYTKSKHK